MNYNDLSINGPHCGLNALKFDQSLTKLPEIGFAKQSLTKLPEIGFAKQSLTKLPEFGFAKQ